MIRTVKQSNLNTHDRISCEPPCVPCFPEALLHSRYIFLRNYTAHYIIFKFKTLAWLKRFYSQPYMSILAAAACLLDISPFSLNLLGNGLSIGHLRFPDICLNLKFPQQPVHNYFEVQFTHAGDNCLGRLFVGLYPE